MTYGATLTALADPTRRAILESLRTKPRSVGEIAKGRPISRPAVSQHLKVLESAKLVYVLPAGNKRLYSLRHDGLSELRKYIDSFWTETLDAYRLRVIQVVQKKGKKEQI